MSSYKNILMELLQEAIAEIYSGALVFHEITESGFYCDFDMPEPMNPEKINEVTKWLSSKDISCAYELSAFSGAYLDGDSRKKMLQRIYVAAFGTQAELQAYQSKIAKAAGP